MAGATLAAGAVNGWTTLAPSELTYAEGQPLPQAATRADITAVIADFVMAAQRAERLGLRVIELHAAHGYLLHQFLSPLSNQRTDAYGGSLANRMRLTLEVFDAVRGAVGKAIALGVRISATDWVRGGWDMEQSIELCHALDARECDFVDVSSGGLSHAQQIPLSPGYQVPFAEAIKKQVRMSVITVGLITEPQQAEEIIASGRADAIALARGMLYDPRWPWHAAATLGGSVFAPPQYARCEPRDRKGLFKYG